MKRRHGRPTVRYSYDATRISSKEQVVLPGAIRRKLGLPTPLVKQDEHFTYPVVVTPTRIITKENYKGYPWEETDVPPADWSIDAFQ